MKIVVICMVVFVVMYASMVLVNAATLYKEMKRSVDESVQTDFDLSSDEEEELFRRRRADGRAQRFLGFFEGGDSKEEEDLDHPTPIPCQPIITTDHTAVSTPLPAFTPASWRQNLTTIIVVVNNGSSGLSNGLGLTTASSIGGDDSILSKRNVEDVLPDEMAFLPNKKFETEVDRRDLETSKFSVDSDKEDDQTFHKDGQILNKPIANDDDDGEDGSLNDSLDSKESKSSEEVQRPRRWLFGWFGSDEEVKPVTASRPEDVECISEKPNSRK